MHVNTDGLNSGANTSYRAADHAYEGAGALSRAGIPGGIFGGFAEAEAFHTVVSGANGRHIAMIQSHCEKLGTVGDKAQHAAAALTEMEARNEERLRAVGDQA